MELWGEQRRQTARRPTLWQPQRKGTSAPKPNPNKLHLPASKPGRSCDTGVMRHQMS
jgi:hypothetical protein